MKDKYILKISELIGGLVFYGLGDLDYIHELLTDYIKINKVNGRAKVGFVIEKANIEALYEQFEGDKHE